MTVDWITVSAQIVNFLILVWLLRRFLYRPVIGAMERRERRIAARLEDAETREREAGEAARRHLEATEDLDRTRGLLVDQARADAEAGKRRLMDEARNQVAETRRQWQRQTEAEREDFLGSLRQQTVGAVQAIARKVLADLADEDLEDVIVRALVKRLAALDDGGLREALGGSAAPVGVVSAFELTEAARSRLANAIQQRLGGDIALEFSRSPTLLCGVEINAGGRRLGWNLDDYLRQLEDRVDDMLEPAAG